MGHICCASQQIKLFISKIRARAMAQGSAKLSFQFFKHFIYKNIEKCIEKEQLSDPTISMSIFSILLICPFSPTTCLKLN